MTSLPRVTAISKRLLLLLLVTGAFSLMGGIWAWPDTCAARDLSGEYFFAGKSGLIRLKLDSSGQGSLQIGEADNRHQFTWEFNQESENVFLTLSGAKASQLRAEFGQMEGPKLDQWTSALVGLNSSCKFGQRKLYIERDSNAYFTEKAPVSK